MKKVKKINKERVKKREIDRECERDKDIYIYIERDILSFIKN